MPKKRDCIRILSVQGDCDGHNETGALDEGLHRLEVKTVYTPCEAITALNAQRFDCVVAMTPPTGRGVTELARKVKESFGLPFLFKAPTRCDTELECLIPNPTLSRVDFEPFCPGGEASNPFEQETLTVETVPPPAFPEYPRVSADGRMVTILWGKEREEVWGEEESEGEAAEVAAEMESELRAVSYVTSRLLTLMGTLNDELIDFGIDQQQVENALWDGYRRILGTFAELDNRA